MRRVRSFRAVRALAAIAERGDEVFWSYDPARERLIYVNDAAARLLGIPRERLLGPLHPVIERVYGADRPRLAALVERARRGETVRGDVRIVRPDGPRWLSVRIHPEADWRGRVTRLVGTAEDVTARRRLVQQFARSSQDQARASAAKSRLLAATSHEIRGSLGAMLGYVELLRNPRLPEPERRAYTEVVRKSSEQLKTIVNDVLDLAKAEAGELRFTKKAVRLPELLAEVAALLQVTARAKGLTLARATRGVIPAVVETDPTRLRQILVNLVGIAIQYTDRGTVELVTEHRRDDGEDLVVFTVRDSGSGMTDDDRLRLLKPFRHARRDRREGAGLGLTVARELARGLGGDVWLDESRVGAGSTFAVAVPAPVSAQRPALQAVRGDGPLPREIAGRRILVAEDAPDARHLMAVLLGSAGAVVETAENGLDAVKRASAEPFDVVLMDIQMPVLDGLEATRALRKRGYDRPIIALTAHAMKQELDECLRSGCNDHIVKPVDSRRLIATVAAFARGDHRTGVRWSPADA